MRLVGSLALQKEGDAIVRYFTEPRPIQFGVGVQGGCELMAAAIDAHLYANKSHITMSCDAANAFNSVCRTKLWTELRRRFPSLEAFVRVLYSRTSNILFQSDGPPGSDGEAPDATDSSDASNSRLEVVLNNVGTRQGCSMGSFIFALMIHPYLMQLAEEFEGRVLVLAFADDVNLCGEPADVVEAYKRWKQLYTNELQGSLRDDMGVVFAPGISDATAGSLSGLGLPCGTQDGGSVGVKVVHDGLRVLGAPVGTSPSSKTPYARGWRTFWRP